MPLSLLQTEGGLTIEDCVLSRRVSTSFNPEADIPTDQWSWCCDYLKERLQSTPYMSEDLYMILQMNVLFPDWDNANLLTDDVFKYIENGKNYRKHGFGDAVESVLLHQYRPQSVEERYESAWQHFRGKWRDEESLLEGLTGDCSTSYIRFMQVLALFFSEKMKGWSFPQSASPYLLTKVYAASDPVYMGDITGALIAMKLFAPDAFAKVEHADFLTFLRRRSKESLQPDQLVRTWYYLYLLSAKSITLTDGGIVAECGSALEKGQFILPATAKYHRSVSHLF